MTAVVAGVAIATGLLVAGPASRAADPCTISWDGGAATHRWFDSANWTGNRLPAADDEVCVGAGNDVQLDAADAKVAGLRLDGSLTIVAVDLEIVGTRESDVTGSLTISTGRLVVDGDLPVASLRQSGGVLLGPGTVSTPDLRWTGGLEQGAGTTEVVGGGAGATIAGGRHPLDNARTLRIDAGAAAVWSAGNIELNGKSRLVNAGLLEIGGDPDLLGCCGTAPEVVNEAGATIRKSDGAGTTELGYPMANDGAVEVVTGTLSIEGGSISGRPSSGSFAVDDGATLLLPSGDMDFDGDSSVVAHGAGEVRITGAVARFAGAVDAPVVIDHPASLAVFESSVTIPRLRLTRGQLTGGGTVATPDFTWTGGTQGGTGTTRIVPGGPGLAIAGGSGGLLALDRRRLEIARDAVASWSGGDLGLAAGAALDNAGLVDVETDAGLQTLCCGAPPLVHNDAGGTFRKSAGGGRSTIGASFQNDGTLEAASGTLDLAGGLGNLDGGELRGGRYSVSATLAVAGAHLTGNAAEVVLDGPASRIEDSFGADALRDLASNLPGGDLTLTGGRSLAPAGDLANEGRVRLAEGAALAPAGSYRQSDGLTAFVAADAVIRPGAGAHLLGGVLAGAGTVDGKLENAGLVDAGAAPAGLVVTGDYAQTAGGTLVARVGPDGVAGRLDVGGSAVLAGTLRIVTLGFEPDPAAEIELIRHGSESGEFDAVEGLAPEAGHSYSPPDYAADAVWLRPGTTPSASIGDAVVTEGDQGDTTATFQVTLDPPPTRSVRLDWRTIDASAVSPADYQPAAGTLVVPHGQSSAEIAVPVHGDTTDEPDETFAVELSSAASATIGRDRGTATILDDDPAPPREEPPPTHEPPPGQGPPPGHGPPPAHKPPHGRPPVHRPRRCVDHLAPRSRIGVARARHRHLRLRGRARDFGCARLRKVTVSVALHGHHRCRFLKSNRRLSKPRRCNRPLWVVAKGTRRWALNPKHRLPRGRYTIRSRAIDRSANKEKKRTKTNAKQVRMR